MYLDLLLISTKALYDLINMKEQSATLEEQYQESMDRKILRAKIECDAEIEILENEIKTLFLKTRNLPNWKLDITDNDLDILASAYNPLAERELKFYVEAKKAHEVDTMSRK